MSTTPPEASTEYSSLMADRRAFSSTRRGRGARSERGRTPRLPGSLSATIFGGGLLGAILLAVSQFTTLYQVHIATNPAPIRSVGTGANHSYSLLPVAVVAAVLAFGYWRVGSRPALLAIGLLGLLALLIGLIGDLPDAHASGLIGSSTTHYVQASNTPSAGLYMETLGAVILLITSVSGFLLIGPPGRRRVRG